MVGGGGGRGGRGRRRRRRFIDKTEIKRSAPCRVVPVARLLCRINDDEEDGDPGGGGQSFD